VVLLAVAQGRFDSVPLEQMAAAEMALRKASRAQLPELARRIAAGEELSDEDRTELLELADTVLAEFVPAEEDEG
jgi:F-type H+/Na+-transporting ATPase subunit alpha